MVDQQVRAGQEKVILTLKVNLLQVDVHVLDLLEDGVVVDPQLRCRIPLEP